MSEDTRAAFEAWFASTRHEKRPERVAIRFDRMEGGDYVHDHTQRHWWTWQNARAAALAKAAKVCENDVDDVSYVHGGTTYDDAGRTRYNCAEAIRSLASED